MSNLHLSVNIIFWLILTAVNINIFCFTAIQAQYALPEIFARKDMSILPGIYKAMNNKHCITAFQNEQENR